MMIESDRELAAMVQELWDNDVNRLIPGKDYRISLQVCKVAAGECRGSWSLTASPPAAGQSWRRRGRQQRRRQQRRGGVPSVHVCRREHF